MPVTTINATDTLKDSRAVINANFALIADIAALAKTDGNIIVGDGTNWVAESGATARVSLGLAIGVNVQAYNANLTAIDQALTVASSPTFANLIATIDIYTVARTDYSAISTIVGWSSFTTKEIFYKRVGGLVFVWFYIYGTSDSTSVTFTLPVATQLGNPWYSCISQDNGGSLVSAIFSMTGSTVSVSKDANGGSWTNSGVKRCSGFFCYPSI